MTFADFGLSAPIIEALNGAGYTDPTPVQQEAIPAVLDGRDLLVSSQTGSGKTAAFMLPALEILSRSAALPAPAAERDTRQRRFSAARPKMLVLAPTRELALQVSAASDKYGAKLRRMRAVAILGGMPYGKQMQLLMRNPEILVATPGRLIDHMQSGKIDFSELKILVLDEADRMLDMGFIDDIETIIAATPEARQTLLFSATLEGDVGRMAMRITRTPQTIRIAGAQTKHENISQKVHFVDDTAHKNRLLDHLLRDATMKQAVVFTATKRDADNIASQLNDEGFAAAPLHGDMHQGARNRTLNALRRGQLRILVATDVAARGIDIPDVTHVFNYDLPKFPEDYVHRIGRTGRAGRSGTAVSLVQHAEGIHVKRIERFTKQIIPIDVVPGYEPQRTPAPKKAKPAGWKPGQNRRSDGGSKGRGGYYGKEDRPARAPDSRKPGFGAGKRQDNFGNRAEPQTLRPDDFGNRIERPRLPPDDIGNRIESAKNRRPDNFGNRSDYTPARAKPTYGERRSGPAKSFGQPKRHFGGR